MPPTTSQSARSATKSNSVSHREATRTNTVGHGGATPTNTVGHGGATPTNTVGHGGATPTNTVGHDGATPTNTVGHGGATPTNTVGHDGATPTNTVGPDGASPTTARNVPWESIEILVRTATVAFTHLCTTSESISTLASCLLNNNFDTVPHALLDVLVANNQHLKRIADELSDHNQYTADLAHRLHILEDEVRQ